MKRRMSDKKRKRTRRPHPRRLEHLSRGKRDTTAETNRLLLAALTVAAHRKASGVPVPIGLYRQLLESAQTAEHFLREGWPWIVRGAK